MNLDGANDKPRLTAEQKKKNHIESEKKRREAIRAGFEKLAAIVPGCEGQARSEAIVLQKTVQFLQEQLAQKDKLRQQAFEQGMSEGDFEQVYRDIEKDAQVAAANGGSGKATSSKTEGGS
ncbi:Transcription factor [Vermiconidia calcicola]|uniref:Transcription factor n=1 Tax=Vermiconidia calcicola TaxID=1690605 RepID=A0ACC3N857_9PEZI|nr:Transcription factor [Vermiconidia calcicola]